MKKVTSILIQGTVFYIEPDAYTQLNAYLKSIKDHFQTFEDNVEIITDIESRIAEKFNNEVITDKHKTITQKDVTHLIESMGTIEDFTQTEDEDPVMIERPIRSIKRMYRDPENAVIAGVSAGIGSYFNIDPIFIRLLFVFFFITGGTSILIYIVLWIALPEAKTPTQKMEMKGDAITLSSLEKNLKNEISSHHQKGSSLSVFLNRQTKKLPRLIQFIASITIPMIRAVGAFFAIGNIFAVVALSVLAGIIATDSYYSYFEPRSQDALREATAVLSSFDHSVFLLAGYVTALIPLLVLILIGLAFALWRNIIKVPVIVTLGAIWFVALGITAFMASNYVPQIRESAERINNRIERQEAQSLTRQEFTVENFSAIHAEGTKAQIILQQSPSYSVSAQGQAERIERLEISTENDVLQIEIGRIESRDHGKICLVGCNPERITITISGPDLTELNISGDIRVSTQDTTLLTTDILSLNLSDMSRVEMNADVASLSASLSGSARLILRGEVATLEAKLDNFSRIEMDEANVQDVKITTRDAARAVLTVIGDITANAYDMSRIEYYGSPEDVQIQEYDTSRIDSLDMDSFEELPERPRQAEYN